MDYSAGFASVNKTTTYLSATERIFNTRSMRRAFGEIVARRFCVFTICSCSTSIRTLFVVADHWKRPPTAQSSVSSGGIDRQRFGEPRISTTTRECPA